MYAHCTANLFEYAILYIMILKRHLTVLSRIINTTSPIEDLGPQREKSPGETKHCLELPEAQFTYFHTYSILFSCSKKYNSQKV